MFKIVASEIFQRFHHYLAATDSSSAVVEDFESQMLMMNQEQTLRGEETEGKRLKVRVTPLRVNADGTLQVVVAYSFFESLHRHGIEQCIVGEGYRHWARKNAYCGVSLVSNRVFFY